MKKTLIGFTILAAATVITSAQVKPGATATDVATYTGADRMEKLIAGAKKEGSVSIYTSLARGIGGHRPAVDTGGAREPEHR